MDMEGASMEGPLSTHGFGRLVTQTPENGTHWPSRDVNVTLTGPIRPDLDTGMKGKVANVTCGFEGQFNVTFGDAFEQEYKRYRFTVDVVLAGFFCVLGLVGNAIAFFVLGHIPGKSTPILLRALAVADSVYLINCVFFQVLKTIHYYVKSFNAAFPNFAYLELVVWPLATMAQTCSVWLVVLVTGDRCLGISRPLHAKSVATSRRALAAIGTVVAFAVTFNIPTIFDVKIKVITDPCTNQTRVETAASSLSWNHTYQLAYKTVLCTIFRTTIPLILVILLNVQIVQAIRKSRKQCRSILEKGHPGQSVVNLHQLVVCVVCIFVICELPDFIYRILRTIMFYAPSVYSDWNKTLYFAHFSNLMLTVNSSVNFVAYLLMGKRFRQVLKDLCCWGRRRTSRSSSNGKSLSTKSSVSTPGIIKCELSPDELFKLRQASQE